MNAKLLFLLGAGLTLYLFLTKKASAEPAPGAAKKLPPGGRTSATPAGPQRVIGGIYDRLPSLQAELQKRAQAVDQAQRALNGAQARGDMSMVQQMTDIIASQVPIIYRLENEIDAVKNQAGVTG